MEYVYAALLLHKLAKPIDENGIRKIVSAAGVAPDDVKVKALVSALSEVNIEEALKSTSVAPVLAPSTATAPPETKKEEAPKEEKPAEEALEGLSSLFG